MKKFVNNRNIETIEFISYTGEYPTLCDGVLTLEINSTPKTFGAHVGCDYPKFWLTGGRVGNYIGIEKEAEQGEWIIRDELLPTELQPFANTLSELFNDNVPHGCCGGCIRW